jgi:hypothetical protein
MYLCIHTVHSEWIKVPHIAHRIQEHTAINMNKNDCIWMCMDLCKFTSSWIYVNSWTRMRIYVNSYEFIRINTFRLNTHKLTWILTRPYFKMSDLFRIYTNLYIMFWIRIWKCAHCRTAAHCRPAGQPHTAARTAGQPHTAAHAAAHTATLPDTAVRFAAYCRTLHEFECRTAAHRTPHTVHRTQSHTVINMI